MPELKILADRQGLLDAIADVAPVLPSRSPKPILAHVLLDVTEDGATVTATDLEIGVRRRCLGIRAESPGRAILPMPRTLQILRTSSDPEVSIEVEGDNLVVRGERDLFTLSSDDATLYPVVPEFPVGGYHAVEAGALKQAIRRTVWATDVESTRYALGGVAFLFDGGVLTAVATDGRRLAKATASALADGDPATPATPVVPAKALKVLEKLLEDGDPPAHVAFDGDRAVLVRTELATVYARLVEGRYPRWQDVFPAGDPALTATVAAGELRRALEKAAIVTSEESRGVDFCLADGLIQFKSGAADKGNAKVDLPLLTTGAPLVIRFDSRYFADALKAVGDEAEVRVEIRDDKSPGVLRVGDDYVYCVMPLSKS